MLHGLMCVLITVISSQRNAHLFSWDMRDLPGSDFFKVLVFKVIGMLYEIYVYKKIYLNTFKDNDGNFFFFLS